MPHFDFMHNMVVESFVPVHSRNITKAFCCDVFL